MSRDGRASEAGWARTVDLHLQAGMIGEPLDSREGVLWTNDFVRDVGGQSD